MKKYLLICTLFMNYFVHTEEIKVTEFRADVAYEQSSTFNYNPELGRAWIETNIKEYYYDPESTDTGATYRFIVKGLSYDKNTKQVIFTNSKNVTIVCVAPISKKHNPKKFAMKETNNCTFVTKKTERLVDDGFYVQKVEYLEIYLHIKE